MDYSAGMRVGPWSDLDRPRGSSGAEPDNRIPVVVLPLAFAVVFWSSPALAQDPSAWGGLFRSRADGATWFRAGQLGRLRDGRVTEFRPPRDGARRFGVAVDAANNVWYPDLSGWLGMLPAASATSREPTPCHRSVATSRAAFAVKTRPTPTITSARPICTHATQRLVSQVRSIRPTRTASRPTTTRTDANPRLKTRTVKSPRISWPPAIAASKMAKAPGSGSSPPATPSPSRMARLGRARVTASMSCVWYRPHPWRWNTVPSSLRAIERGPHWLRSIQRPMRMTRHPVPAARYASTRCGISHVEPSAARTATRTIPLVCDSVTNRPRTKASIGRPRTPTMYDAAMVLPCPGVAAWSAPSQKLDTR